MLTIRILLIAAIAANAGRAVTPENDKLPMFFVGNQGQAPAAVRFMAKASRLNAYFLNGEAVFAEGNTSVRVRFEGANPQHKVQGMNLLPGRANFLEGAEEQWRVDLPLYGGITYRDLYPGIDMVYGGNGRDLKSEFVVASGAEPSKIRMRYSGAVSIDARGGLVIPLGDRTMREDAPAIYQEKAGIRTHVDGRYSLAADGAVSFVIGEYDRTRTLVIDPVLSYSTLLGGTSSNAITALAVDASGSAYVAGITASFDFPVSGAFQNSNSGGNDIFIAKLTSSGNGLVYCTYLGGFGDDRGYGIAVDASGSAFITGSTMSPNFPLQSPLQAKLAGGRNAFVTKLSPTGNSLLYSTYLGGNGSDIGYGIAVDSNGNAYIVGDTTSSNFPASGFQRTNKGAQDAFVAKVSASGSQLLYSTYLGGSSIDHGAAISVDASGSAYVTGSTYSTDFPTASAWQPSNAGGQDVFISRLSADGGTLLFSTYLGGSAGTVSYPEGGSAIAVDHSGNAYVTGVTSSTNFPLLNPMQSLLTGTTDVFVGKVTASGTLVYSTYLGGSGQQVGTAIAVESGGKAWITGYEYSTDLPVTANALQTTSGGAYDAFIAELNATGNSLLYLSYLGGNGSDAAAALALDAANNIYIAGWTMSTNFPVLNAYQATNPGNYAAFVTKMSIPSLPANVSVTPNSGTGGAQIFSFQYSDLSGANDLTTVSSLLNSTSSVVTACAVVYNRAQNTLALMTDTGALPATSITPGSGTQQNSQCALNGSGSSVLLQGTVLSLNLALTFPSGFSGSRNVYMQAVNPAGSTGWQQMGTWTIPQPPPPPAVVSVTPNSGSGANQTFSYLISDQQGATDVAQVWMEISTGLVATANSCYTRYDAGPNALYLYNDAATAWLGPITPGSSATLQNSQCVLNASGSGASPSGNNLTVKVSLSLNPAFVGLKTIYAYANNASANSGWQTEGSWTVTGPSNPLSVVSVTPSSGSGVTQTFSYVFSDSYGASDITNVYVFINANLTTVTNSCYVRYDASANALYVINDTNSAWFGPSTPGTTAVLQNSQCILSASASSISSSGNNLTLNVALSFKPTFAGVKTSYGYAANGAGNTGWQALGAWTVPNPANSINASVTPNAGVGSSQTFTFLVADQKGASDLQSIWMFVSSSLVLVTNSCLVQYNFASNYLFLINDANSGWSGPVKPGTATTLQNSQCTLNVAAMTVSLSGNYAILTVPLTFKTSAFAGFKNLYIYANGPTANTGWQLAGTWTIN